MQSSPFAGAPSQKDQSNQIKCWMLTLIKECSIFHYKCKHALALRTQIDRLKCTQQPQLKVEWPKDRDWTKWCGKDGLLERTCNSPLLFVRSHISRNANMHSTSLSNRITSINFSYCVCKMAASKIVSIIISLAFPASQFQLRLENRFCRVYFTRIQTVIPNWGLVGCFRALNTSLISLWIVCYCIQTLDRANSFKHSRRVEREWEWK